MKLIAAAVGCLVIAGSVVAADEFVVRKSTQAAGERYVPGVWVDPDGCEHWIIDDGVEGYLSARLDKYGKPVCSGIAQPNTAIGDFKNGRRDSI